MRRVPRSGEDHSAHRSARGAPGSCTGPQRRGQPRPGPIAALQAPRPRAGRRPRARFRCGQSPRRPAFPPAGQGGDPRLPPVRHAAGRTSRLTISLASAARGPWCRSGWSTRGERTSPRASTSPPMAHPGPRRPEHERRGRSSGMRNCRGLAKPGAGAGTAARQVTRTPDDSTGPGSSLRRQPAGTNTSGPCPRRRQYRRVGPGPRAVLGPAAPSTSRPTSPASLRRASPGPPLGVAQAIRRGKYCWKRTRASAFCTRAAAILAGSPARGESDGSASSHVDTIPAGPDGGRLRWRPTAARPPSRPSRSRPPRSGSRVVPGPHEDRGQFHGRPGGQGIHAASFHLDVLACFSTRSSLLEPGYFG